jgi:hypothetical protein
MGVQVGNNAAQARVAAVNSLERLLQALLFLMGLAAAGGAVANERDLVEAWSSPPLYLVWSGPVAVDQNVPTANKKPLGKWWMLCGLQY